MQLSSSLLLKTAIGILGVILCLGLLLSYGLNDREAQALSGGEWETVRQALDNYWSGQYSDTATDPSGEASFVRSPTTYLNQIDTNLDGVYLGEGDDAANAPVLVDVLQRPDIIPGTNYQVTTSWNSTADATNAPAIAAKVQHHRDAGFSSDIVTYCLTGHTEGKAAGALGALSGAGYFGSQVRVESLEHGRMGWDTVPAWALPSYPNGGLERWLKATPDALPAARASTNAACAGVTPNSELVRCVADATLAAATAGQNPWTMPDATYTPVDLRPVVPSTEYIANGAGGGAMHIPVDTLFSTSVFNAETVTLPTNKIVFYGDTQHIGLAASTGAAMLGIGATDGLRFGLPYWNSTVGATKWTSHISGGYVASIDTTAPTITVGPSESNITQTSVDISRTTDEPATSKIEYEVAGSGVWMTANDTVLNASKTVNISGLTADTTYNYKLTAYDGVANSSTMATGSFTTLEPACSPAKPALTVSTRFAYWASPADYAAGLLTVKLRITNSGAADTGDAINVMINSSANTNGVTMTGNPYAVGSINGGSFAEVDVQYMVPGGVRGFMSQLAASADDVCGSSYTYP